MNVKAKLRIWCATAFLLQASAAFAQRTDQNETGPTRHSILVETDAHEGPIVVPSQNRLYFTTVPDFKAENTHIAIRYVDLDTLEVGTFSPRSNMANGMWLTPDGMALLVAEQGTTETPGGISRIRLADGHREVVVDSYEGKPFNSPNKVIEADSGWIYFSDPDYGYHQGFKGAPALPMAVYAHNPTSGGTFQLTTEVARPHGLALSMDENLLYIGDTDAIDGSTPYDPSRSREVLSTSLLAPDRIGPLDKVLSVPVGIPDGIIVVEPSGEIWVAAGDGVRRYTADGAFVELFPIEGGAFNLTQYGDVVYSTANTAIWQTKIDAE
jgi:gluconolactonase